MIDQQTRSRMMAGIRGKDTRPELAIRKALHALGFRYRLHARDIPGRPDMAFPRYRAVIFVHGCFWHGHDCALFRLPGTRTEFWAGKIAGNRTRDAKVAAELDTARWRHLTIWECAFRGRGGIGLASVIGQTAAWIRSDEGSREIRGEF
ncbi:very short patch repair endonuclease [Alsobacter sp. SYSU M60028]|uniref:Very short patch repair endonuclease n=1 Tax=Alsobacter ponti TaxID=2962936 RepID=A0ABT1LG36_9HYPH|nr:very short patch repair endonuclease [Alsobacter ponti]MCP8939921.1 very short patch repair endonuclease [Alsobacter ponti]